MATRFCSFIKEGGLCTKKNVHPCKLNMHRRGNNVKEMSGFISAPQTWTETGSHPAYNRCPLSISLGVAVINLFAHSDTLYIFMNTNDSVFNLISHPQLTKNSPSPAFKCIIHQVIQLHPCRRVQNSKVCWRFTIKQRVHIHLIVD